MNRLVQTMAGIGVMASVAVAQNTPSLEQLQKTNDDLLVQLKNAQDRKNELATKNAELQKKLEESDQQVKGLQTRIETLENRAYFFREHLAMWQSFLDANAPVRMMWEEYFATSHTSEMAIELLGDGHWPFNVEG